MRWRFWREAVAVVVLLAAGVWGVKALLLPGFFSSHDGAFHASKLVQYVTLLADGQLPPRWSGSLNGGLGYPVFVYTYPLPFALAGLFYGLGVGIAASLKWVLGLSYVLSGIGMYWFLRQRVGRTASLVGAVFFLYAPYRFSLIFVRAAVGEAVAIAILPWILGTMEKVAATSSRRWIVGLGVIMALAVCAHSLFLPMFLPLLLLYGWWRSRGDKHARIGLVKGAGYGAVLAAFYLVPLIWERQYVVFDQNYVRRGAEHLVTWWQLYRSPWGYGFSFFNVADDAMSFQVGLTQILVTGLSLAWLGWQIVRRRWGRQETVLAGGLGVGLLAAYLMVDSPLTRWVWTKVPVLGVIDFPWRLLGVTTVAASMVAAQLVQSWRWAGKLLAPLLIILVMVANRNHTRINLPYTFDEEGVKADDGTTTFANEFRPVWREGNEHNSLGARVVVLAEKEKLRMVESRSNLIVFTTEFEEPQTVYVNSLYFPGWRAQEREGERWRELELGESWKLVEEPWGGHSYQEVSGTTQIKVPSGEQKYRLVFGETPVRMTGDLITLVGLAALPFALGHKPALRKKSKQINQKRQRAGEVNN